MMIMMINIIILLLNLKKDTCCIDKMMMTRKNIKVKIYNKIVEKNRYKVTENDSLNSNINLNCLKWQ